LNALLSLTQLIVSLLFFLLGVVAFRDWLREREPSRGWLALAIGALGLVSLIGRIQTAAGTLSTGNPVTGSIGAYPSTGNCHQQVWNGAPNAFLFSFGADNVAVTLPINADDNNWHHLVTT